MSDEFIAKRKSRDEKPKKERKLKKNGKLRMGCWGRCAITCTIIFVVLISGIIGGSFWAWGKYVKPGMQMTLPKFVGILGKTYTYSEKKLVTNPFNAETDLASFYDGFKEKAMIDKDVIIKLEDILLSKKKDSVPVAPVAYNINSVSPLGLQDKGTTGNVALDELLKGLKFDFSSLENYAGNPYILEVTDKQIAALLNQLFSKAISSDSIKQFKDFEANYGVKLQELVAIKQVVIDGKTVGDKVVPRLKITMMIEPRPVVKKLCEQKGLPKIISSLLPKKIYVSMNVFPTSKDLPAEVTINNVNETDFSDLIKGVDGLLQSYGGSPTGISNIFKTINDAIVNALEKVNNIVPLSFVDSGSLQAQPIKALMNVLKVTVSEGQFLNMLKDVILPTAKSLGLDKFTKDLRDQNVTQFIGDFTHKYGIGHELAKDITPDNAFTQIKTITAAPNFVDNINLKGAVDYTKSYNENVKNSAKVEASYMSFAGLINSYIKDNPALLGSFNVTVMKVEYLKNDNTIFGQDKAATDVMSVLVSFNLHDMLKIDANTIFGNLLGQLVPKELFIEVFMDMKSDEGYISNGTVLSINNSSIELTKMHVETLTQILVGIGKDGNTLNYDAMATKISNAIKSGITNLEKMLKSKILFENEKLLLPNIFELVSGTTFVNPIDLPEGQKKFSDEEVFNALSLMYVYRNNSTNCVGETGVGFARELEQKFYIKNIRNGLGNNIPDKNPDGSDITENLLGNDGEKLVETLKSMPEKFQENISISRMNSDETDLGALKPWLSENEMGYFVTKNGGINIGFMKDTIVVGNSIFNNLLIMTISGGIVVKEPAPVPGEAVIPPRNLDGILPEKLFIKVEIDINKMNDTISKVTISGDGNLIIPTDPEGTPDELKKYNCIKTITINDLDDTRKGTDNLTDFERFILLVGRMSNSPIYVDTIKSDLKVSLIKFMHQINAGGKINFMFEDSGLTIDTTIFDMAVNQIYSDDININNLPATLPENKKLVPKANEFRDILRKSSLIPDNLKNGKYSSSESIIDQINSKYFLTNDSDATDGVMNGGKLEYIVNAGTSEIPIWTFVDKNGNGADGLPVEKTVNIGGVDTIINLTRADINILELLKKNGLESNYMTKVDGGKMASGILDNTVDFVSDGTLQPYFDKSQLARLLKGAISVASSIGISNTELLQVSYIPGEVVDGSNEILQIILGGNISNSGATAEKYNEFIPDEIRIVVNINYSQLKADLKKTDEEILNEEIMEGKKKNYCTFTINDMTNKDIVDNTDSFKGDNLKCFVSVMNKISGKTMVIDDICAEFSLQIRKQFKSFANGFDLTFVSDKTNPDDNGVKLGSVYEIAAAGLVDVNALDLETAFKNLHRSIANYGTEGEETDFVKADNPIGFDGINVTVKLNEKNVGGLIIADKTKITSSLNGIIPTLRRVGLLNYKLSTKPTELPFAIGNFKVEEGSNDEYIMVSMSVTSQKVLGKVNTLLPNDIYVTICICINDGADPLKNTVVFANLDSGDKNIMKKLFEKNKDSSGNLDSIFGNDVETKLLQSIKDMSVGKITGDPSERSVTIGQVISKGTITFDGTDRWIGFEKSLAELFV